MKIEYYVEFGERSSHTGREVACIEKFEGDLQVYHIFFNHCTVTRCLGDKRFGLCLMNHHRVNLLL